MDFKFNFIEDSENRTDRTNEFNLGLREYEPMKENRFLVRFPNEYYVAEWKVHSISGVKYNNVTSRFENIVVSFRRTIVDDGITEVFDNMLRSDGFQIELDMLDPVGTVVYKSTIDLGSVVSVSNCDLNYTSNETFRTNVEFTVTNVVNQSLV